MKNTMTAGVMMYSMLSARPVMKPPHGPMRAARERIRAAGVRQRRRHLGEAEDQPEIHDRDDDRGDEQAAPAAGADAEVPAGEVTGDDGADAERPQRPDARVAPQSALLEVVLAGILVGDAADGFLVSHATLPISCCRVERSRLGQPIGEEASGSAARRRARSGGLRERWYFCGGDAIAAQAFRSIQGFVRREQQGVGRDDGGRSRRSRRRR